MVHAWLVIQPEDPEDPSVGIQRKFSGVHHMDLRYQMGQVLRTMGASDTVKFEPGRNLEGAIRSGSGDREEAAEKSGLKWVVCPCTKDGRNLHLSPPERMGE